jgi:hypothetical protein
MAGSACRFLATRQAFQWGLLLSLTVMVWAGCKQDVNVAADTNAVGIYTLASIDGNKLPYTAKHQGDSPTFKSGTFTINSDGTCGKKWNFSFPSVGDCSRELTATYTRQGSKLAMRWKGAGMATGTVEGDTFTMNDEGLVLAYRK